MSKSKDNKRLIILLALIVVVGAAIYLLPTPEPATPQTEEVATPEPTATGVAVDDDAPNFEVTLTSGETLTLESLRGKVVLLNFWATWCPPCREELKRVQSDLIDAFEGRDFVFLPISRGEQRDVVVEFLKTNGYTFAAGLDPEQKIYDAYATEYIPRNYLINRHGVVVEATVGYEPEEFDELLKVINMTLNAR